MRILTRAKLNLVLRIVRTRPDGFHDIESVMQAIDLFDEISIKPATSNRVSFSWAPGLEGPLPTRPDLVELAIDRFLTATGVPGKFEAVVVKRIPLGAGLGGGSADAAAALLGLNQMHGRPLSSKSLFALAAELGSDAAFGLQGGTAYAAGRGERLWALQVAERFWWVIGFPPFPMATRDVYRRFDEMGGSGESSDLEGIKTALRDADPVRLSADLANDLEAPAFDLRPELRSLKSQILAAGALGAVMAGSGSSIAGLCRDQSHAVEIAARVAGHFSRVEIVSSASQGAELFEGA